MIINAAIEKPNTRRRRIGTMGHPWRRRFKGAAILARGHDGGKGQLTRRAGSISDRRKFEVLRSLTLPARRGRWKPYSGLLRLGGVGRGSVRLLQIGEKEFREVV